MQENKPDEPQNFSGEYDFAGEVCRMITNLLNSYDQKVTESGYFQPLREESNVATNILCASKLVLCVKVLPEELNHIENYETLRWLEARAYPPKNDDFWSIYRKNCNPRTIRKGMDIFRRPGSRNDLTQHLRLTVKQAC